MRRSLLEDARIRLSADYAVALVGQAYREREYAVLEFDEAPYRHVGTAAERSRQQRWRIIGMKLNVHPVSARLLKYIGEGAKHKLAPKAVLMRKLQGGTLREKIATAFNGLLAFRLYQDWKAQGLDDFIFSSCRLDAPQPHEMQFGSGIGYHRLAHRNAFSERDFELAHAISISFPWLHSINVSSAVNVANALRRHPACKVVFPFLLKDLGNEEIALMIGRSKSTIEKQIPEIAHHLELRDRTREAIRERMRITVVPDLSTDDVAEDMRRGFSEL